MIRITYEPETLGTLTISFIPITPSIDISHYTSLNFTLQNKSFYTIGPKIQFSMDPSLSDESPTWVDAPSGVVEFNSDLFSPDVTKVTNTFKNAYRWARIVSIGVIVFSNTTTGLLLETYVSGQFR